LARDWCRGEVGGQRLLFYAGRDKNGPEKKRFFFSGAAARPLGRGRRGRRGNATEDCPRVVALRAAERRPRKERAVFEGPAADPSGGGRARRTTRLQYGGFPGEPPPPGELALARVSTAMFGILSIEHGRRSVTRSTAMVSSDRATAGFLGNLPMSANCAGGGTCD